MSSRRYTNTKRRRQHPPALQSLPWVFPLALSSLHNSFLQNDKVRVTCICKLNAIQTSTAASGYERCMQQRQGTPRGCLASYSCSRATAIILLRLADSARWLTLPRAHMAHSCVLWNTLASRGEERGGFAQQAEANFRKTICGGHLWCSRLQKLAQMRPAHSRGSGSFADRAHSSFWSIPSMPDSSPPSPFILFGGDIPWSRFLGLRGPP